MMYVRDDVTSCQHCKRSNRDGAKKSLPVFGRFNKLHETEALTLGLLEVDCITNLFILELNSRRISRCTMNHADDLERVFGSIHVSEPPGRLGNDE